MSYSPDDYYQQRLDAILRATAAQQNGNVIDVYKSNFGSGPVLRFCEYCGLEGAHHLICHNCEITALALLKQKLLAEKKVCATCFKHPAACTCPKNLALNELGK